MTKKKSAVMVSIVCLSVLIISDVYAGRLLTKDMALERIFGDGCTYKTVSKTISIKVINTIKAKLGRFVFFDKRSESKAVAGAKKIDFIVAKKGGNVEGIALIDVEPGKWGPVQFMIAFTPDGKVKRVEVMAFREIRGRPIARRIYMEQYEGKSVDSPIKIGNDIRGITGATVSSKSACFAVKKGLILFKELYKR